MFSQDQQQAEYSELCSAFRHYSGLRFAVLAVFFGLLGGAVQANVSAAQANQFFMAIATKAIGLLMTLAFWFFEYRVSSYILYLEEQLARVEKSLGYIIYSGRRSKSRLLFIKTPMITTVIYGLVTFFWLFSFFAT
ncbi:MAG: hypothetical protein DCF19_00040 [Pseudanabaena frigida]|uniref:DUF1230 domain-containing protein n=1 Tax=Pseudanabaena frigida TaxID=945775 RepID=A0A2W4WP20_9CYAN|nr:MAG: hypothetical protein DCF19_00040 [Pseudanabaena frigida]